MLSVRKTRVQRIPADEALVQRARLGDRIAFTELYRRHVGVVYNLVKRLAGREQDSDELVQEIFYQAYRNLSRFEGRSTFLTWLYRIATNIAYMHMKRCARRQKFVVTRRDEEHDPLETVASRSPDPLAEAERRSFYQVLGDAVSRLPFSQRVVVVLGPIQGHSYREMSDILAIPLDAIKGRLHRARVHLRRILHEEGVAPEVLTPLPVPLHHPSTSCGMRAS